MSKSTTEAELAAAHMAIGRMGMPLHFLWSSISERTGIPTAGLGVLLDDTAMIEILCTGRNLTIRHIGKTHGVAIAWLHEMYDRPDVWMRYISTTRMAADLHTKVFTERNE